MIVQPAKATRAAGADCEVAQAPPNSKSWALECHTVLLFLSHYEIKVYTFRRDCPGFRVYTFYPWLLQSPGTQNPLPKKLTRDPEVSVGHGREEKMYRNSIHETQQNETAHCRRNV